MCEPDSVGGVVAEIFPVAAGEILFFLDISGPPGDHPPFMNVKNVTSSNSLDKKTFTKSLGGHASPGYAPVINVYITCDLQ